MKLVGDISGSLSFHRGLISPINRSRCSVGVACRSSPYPFHVQRGECWWRVMVLYVPILHCRNAVLNLSVSSISAVVDRAWFTPTCRNFSTFPVAICLRMTLALAPVAARYGDAALPALRFISSTSVLAHK